MLATTSVVGSIPSSNLGEICVFIYITRLYVTIISIKLLILGNYTDLDKRYFVHFILLVLGVV